MQVLLIFALSVAAAVLYGLVHDQVTVRVCLEYFTIGHPPVFPTEDPTLLALGWGVIATWWAGLILAVPLALGARAGRRPKRSARSLLRPVAVLLAVMALGALAAGTTGYLLARSDVVWLAGLLAGAVPDERHDAFLAAAWAHTASYGIGFLGGLVVSLLVWRSRRPRDEVSRGAPAAVR